MSKKNKKEERERDNSESEKKHRGNRAERRPSNASFSKFCAFWGITFAALLFLINGILQMLVEVFGVNPGGIYDWISALDFVSKLALLFAIAVPAYGYVSNKRLVWKIIYVAAIVFYACFCIYRLF